MDLPPDQFVAALKPHERVLLELKDRLYEGSWDRLLEDLEARLNNKPYIFKISKTVERDLASCKRLKAYEEKHKIALREELGK